LFAATHASCAGLVVTTTAPSLAGEVMRVVTQLGTIGLARALRFRLVVRYAPRGAAIAAPGVRANG
jgi:hypothetical protein